MQLNLNVGEVLGREGPPWNSSVCPADLTDTSPIPLACRVCAALKTRFGVDKDKLMN